jgi:hypothetical protein
MAPEYFREQFNMMQEQCECAGFYYHTLIRFIATMDSEIVVNNMRKDNVGIFRTLPETPMSFFCNFDKGVITLKDLQEETTCLICKDLIAAGTTVTQNLPARKMRKVMRKAKHENKAYHANKCTCKGAQTRRWYQIYCVTRVCYISTKTGELGAFNSPLFQKNIFSCKMKDIKTPM